VVTRDVPEGMLAYGNPARAARKLTKEEIQKYLISMGLDD
jgi:acetyltransferase-like isoleucine patch superfamily enzyme